MATVQAQGRPQRLWKAVRKTAPTADGAGPDTYPAVEIAAMLRSLGIAMLEVGHPTNLVAERLLAIASAYTTSAVRLAVFPATIIVHIDDAQVTDLDETTRATVRLDQASTLADIAIQAAAGAIAPRDAVDAVDAMREMPPRFGAALTICGYVLATVGFGMMLNPTWQALPAYVVLGAVAGLVLVGGRRFPALAPIQATVAAFLVTVLAVWFAVGAADEDLLRVVAPPLIAVLPGFALTTGAIELASGQRVAGASRLIHGVAQLAMLTAGVVVGLRVAGSAQPGGSSAPMGGWSFYVAVLVMAIGLYWYLSAPRGSLLWLVLGLGVALLGQQVGLLFLEQSMAGGLGAIVAVIFAVFAAGFKTAPPPMVMVLTVFWGLVPGALSFIQFTERATGEVASFSTVQSTGAAVLAIALGILIGWSIIRMSVPRLRLPV
ncbi:MAG: threonine/serine exporter family protein [Actinomycetota bacterium]|nr:threonine/serine exporter family protein [Actinomycetota bacterium]